MENKFLNNRISGKHTDPSSLRIGTGMQIHKFGTPIFYRIFEYMQRINSTHKDGS
jgi:hypothetical protein